jgi:hypothetical protein
METLVTMRAHVGRLLRKHSELGPLDADLKYLFGLWFNRGFLRLERIGWHTSALILEKLIEYESVHEINGWPDLRRRLAPDRRCFAFFHPALIDEPIIFVEIALTKGLVGELDPLLDLNTPVLAPEEADTATFYSISNCLNGLRGISFGNFLIKQVVVELGNELPALRSRRCRVLQVPCATTTTPRALPASGFLACWVNMRQNWWRRRKSLTRSTLFSTCWRTRFLTATCWPGPSTAWHWLISPNRE